MTILMLATSDDITLTPYAIKHSASDSVKKMGYLSIKIFPSVSQLLFLQDALLYGLKIFMKGQIYICK